LQAPGDILAQLLFAGEKSKEVFPMKMKQHPIFLAGALILAILLTSGMAQAQNGGPQSPAASLGTAFTYQGRLEQDGTPVDDTCDMRFRLYDAASAGSQVGSTINTGVPIVDGYFTVNLDFGTGAFDGDRRWLEIRVDCDGGGYTNLGREELTAAPYALYAARSGGPQNVVTVAQSNGDYASIQAAIDSITDAAEGNGYLVWVAPGVYSETVTMKPHVHLQGAGQEATVITSTASNGSTPTLLLASDSSVRDLTVGNSGAGTFNAAVLAGNGTTRTLMIDVTAQAQGNGTNNYAFLLIDSGTGVTLQHVTGLAENGGYNFGLHSIQGANVVVRASSFTARGGTIAEGIYSHDSGTVLDAESVTSLGENGSFNNHGLNNGDGAKATLRGGSFTAAGGSGSAAAWGIVNSDSGTMLHATGSTVLGQNGITSTFGLINFTGADATLLGGSFTAHGGDEAAGIFNHNSGTTLQATGVTALGQSSSSYTYGLHNDDGADATLYGGTFTAREGNATRGIHNQDTGTSLEAADVTALAENGDDSNYGLYNEEDADAVLHGGAFTAQGGHVTRGIWNHDSNTTLQATGVIALAENGSDSNNGLRNTNGADAVLHGGSFTARGGTIAWGIVNGGSGATLLASSITGLGESGSSTSYGLYTAIATTEVDSSRFAGSTYALQQDSGTARLGVTQLDGGANRASGTLTCFQVYNGSYAGYTCP
jgi:hypothetical protein